MPGLIGFNSRLALVLGALALGLCLLGISSRKNETSTSLRPDFEFAPPDFRNEVDSGKRERIDENETADMDSDPGAPDANEHDGEVLGLDLKSDSNETENGADDYDSTSTSEGDFIIPLEKGPIQYRSASRRPVPTGANTIKDPKSTLQMTASPQSSSQPLTDDELAAELDPDTQRDDADIVSSSALLIPVHVWSASIAKGMQPFVTSAQRLGMDVHVLGMGTYATGDLVIDPPVAGLPDWERRSLQKRGVRVGAVFTHHSKWENVIRTFHSRAGVQGFRSPWLSNHILLFAWHNRHGAPRNYSRVWSVEGDVRAVGNLSALWTHAPRAHYVSTGRIIPLRAGHWAHAEFTGGESYPPEARFYALKQVWAISRPMIEYASGLFREGTNGQDETILASIAMDFTRGERSLLGNLADFACKGWTWDPKAARRIARQWHDDAHLAAKWGARLQRNPRDADAAAKLQRLLPHGVKLYHPIKE